MTKSKISWCLFLSMLSLHSWAKAELEKNVFDEGDEFADFYGGDEFITIATGYSKPINKAPAVASVITKQHIAQSGAQDIRDVLEMVPGLHVERHQQNNLDKFVIRGIASTYGPQTLLMINDTPVTSLFTGNQSNVWAGMPVHAIERIEVIRGPGSAIYGADAFAGVINIITRDSRLSSENKMGLTVGSFNTRNSYIQLANNQTDLTYFMSLEYGKTDGESPTVNHDAQTTIDNAVGTNASLAPGTVNRSVDTTEARVELNYQDLKFRAGFQGRYNIGTDFGVAGALDPNGRYGSERTTFDLSYQKKLLAQWEYQLKASYYHGTMESEEDTYLFPAGGFYGLYPDGMIGNPEFKEQNTRLSGTLNYKGDTHLVRMGVGLFDGGIYEVTESKNFDSNFMPLPNGLTNVSDTSAVFLPENRRDNQYFYIQDEWQLLTDWELTVGARYDDYSDFGSTLNPRLALVWSADYNLSVKALFGRAFRAPSFTELYAINNPVALGNPNLKPEVINTYEVALSYKPTSNLEFDINVFNYHIDDSIQFVPDAGASTVTAQNAGEQTGYGIEFEAKAEINTQWHVSANYAYQDSEMKINFADNQSITSSPGHAPNHSLYITSHNQLSDHWQFNLQWNYIGKRDRVDNDPRNALQSYHKVDATLIASEIINKVDLSLSIKNLLNDDIKEPSIGPAQGTTAVDIPGDLPLYERSLWVNVKYNF